MTPTTLVAILSLLQRPAERAAFSPLAWSQRNLRLTKSSRGGDRQQDDVVVTQR
jgi:hypothetical protein